MVTARSGTRGGLCGSVRRNLKPEASLPLHHTLIQKNNPPLFYFCELLCKVGPPQQIDQLQHGYQQTAHGGHRAVPHCKVGLESCGKATFCYQWHPFSAKNNDVHFLDMALILQCSVR